ncbi:hypothetical protein ND920_14745 [Vibrio ordalii]|uniref:hypothetical protein n=1 Tax=Vibrio TaxID=662 RepID=UPI001372BC42|nr:MULTISPECIES: hypothetical protein [Vibrio]MCS0352845.1 hypothetical protein [Vibrio ordalii]NAW97240.1 hypothetical protein [Vibrio sp. V23_P3S9T160]
MKAGKIRRSIQRFYDYSRDLINADMNTFDDRLDLLISFCKDDDFFSKLDQQLIANPKAEFDSWYKAASSFDNRGSLSFPTNIDERLSIMYELLCRIKNKQIDLISFCSNNFVISSSRIDEYIYSFNDVVSEPLFRELGYRLEDIQDELPVDNTFEVASPILQIIHHAENVIQQNAFGNNNQQSAEIHNSNDELTRLFIGLRNEVNSLSISPEDKADSIDSIDTCEELAKVEKPRKGTIEKLLNMLPKMGNVASIVSAIITIIGTVG